MYKDKIKGWIKHGDFLLIDILCLELSLLIAYIFRNGISEGRLPGLYKDMMLSIILIDICAVFFCNSYEDIIHRGYLIELKQVLTHCIVVECGMIFWMFLIKESSSYSRLVIISVYPISVCLMIVARLAWKRVIRLRIKGRKDLRKVMVITTDQRAKDVINGLLCPYREYQVSAIAIYDNGASVGKKIRGIPVVADYSGIIGYMQENVVDELFIDLPGYEDVEEKYMNLFVNMGMTVHVNLSGFGSSMKNKRIYTFGKFTVLSTSMKFSTPRQLLIKRIMDICGALVGLIITGIAFVIFGPIIKRQSPGPVFFSQERVGRNGRTFRIYKFRTMYMDAEERKKELMEQNKMKGLMFKMDNDPRIIPIGHFLRKSSIDELPQFWNVLKGEMSLVGTRPPTVDEYKQYETQHRKRLAIKPGITGMWQVSGRSDIVDFEEVVALDAKYITEWSLRMDIKILWKTVLIVLKGEGAV